MEPIRNGKNKNAEIQRLSTLLTQAIRYALEQKNEAAAMRNLALTDDLTGLHNRRAFLALARQQLKQAKRTGRPTVLIFADIDGLKQVNDQFGHHVGDDLLQDAAAVLVKTFRDSDIIARLGGDEFVILAGEANASSPETIYDRLHRNVEAHNRQNGSVPLSISVGVVPFRQEKIGSIEELLISADRAMYARKKHARSTVAPSGNNGTGALQPAAQCH